MISPSSSGRRCRRRVTSPEIVMTTVIAARPANQLETTVWREEGKAGIGVY